MTPMAADDRDPLERELYVGGSYRRFGELTAADARAQAAELGATGGWGPLVKVAGVALAWRELAEALEAVAAEATVADLDEGARERFAHRLWVLPPGGSLL
jgi:hypothetical protein